MQQYQIVVRFPGWCGVGVTAFQATTIDAIRSKIREYINERTPFVYYDEHDGHPVVVNPWLCPVIEIEEIPED